jgi:hypothetical protein
MKIQIWPIDKFVLYARNPRKNDAAVDRMCASIREFGFKIPCLVATSRSSWTGSLIAIRCHTDCIEHVRRIFDGQTRPVLKSGRQFCELGLKGCP